MNIKFNVLKTIGLVMCFVWMSVLLCLYVGLHDNSWTDRDNIKKFSIHYRVKREAKFESSYIAVGKW